MKIKKTMTPKAIAANQANAQQARGPKNTAAVSQNARKHGLLAKRLPLQTEEEKKEFHLFLGELKEELRPTGPMEGALVEEIAVCLWKLQSANAWEVRELANRREATKAIMKSVAETYYEENLSLFNSSNGKPSAAQFGWDCHELIVRSGTRNSEQENPSSGDWNGKAGHVQIEAKLNTSLDSILRYQAAIKRDLYRAMAALRAMRRDERGER